MRLFNEAAELVPIPVDAFEHVDLIFFLIVNHSNLYSLRHFELFYFLSEKTNMQW